MFDLDGTLIDSMPQHARVFSNLLAREFGIPADEALLHYRRTAGASFATQLREAVSSSIHLDDERIEDLTRRFIAVVSATNPRLFPDVPLALPQLKAAGFRLAIT